MARYEYVNETSYKTPIPYHFTCNYCGEAAWFKADCMKEPNDPEKLPVID